MFSPLQPERKLCMAFASSVHVTLQLGKGRSALLPKQSTWGVNTCTNLVTLTRLTASAHMLEVMRMMRAHPPAPLHDISIGSNHTEGRTGGQKAAGRGDRGEGSPDAAAACGTAQGLNMRMPRVLRSWPGSAISPQVGELYA